MAAMINITIDTSKYKVEDTWVLTTSNKPLSFC